MDALAFSYRPGKSDQDTGFTQTRDFLSGAVALSGAEVVRLDQYGSEDPLPDGRSTFLQEKGDGAGRLFDMDARLKSAINVMHHQLSLTFQSAITGSRPAMQPREYRLQQTTKRLPALR